MPGEEIYIDYGRLYNREEYAAPMANNLSLEERLTQFAAETAAYAERRERDELEKKEKEVKTEEEEEEE